jgi:hypothetical protein
VTRNGDELIERLTAGGDDETAYALLTEFFHGYPIERLRLLLRSQHEGAVKIGAWIASELGVQANPLVEEMAELLSHGSRYVRFFLLDSILSASTEQNGRSIAAAVKLIEDSDDAVRWKAMNFLARAKRSQLTAAQPYLTDTHAQLSAWLLETEQALSTEEVIARLESPDSLSRLVAAAAAARLGSHNLSALRHAAQSSDPEVQSFALEHLGATEKSDSSA